MTFLASWSSISLPSSVLYCSSVRNYDSSESCKLKPIMVRIMQLDASAAKLTNLSKRFTSVTISFLIDTSTMYFIFLEK